MSLIAVLVLSLPASAKLSFIVLELPPYSYRDESGNFQGLYYEVVKQFCEQVKEDCTFSSVPPRRAFTMMAKGEADGIVVFDVLEARKVYAHYTDTNISACFSFMGHKDEVKKIKTETDLNGRKIFYSGPNAVSEQLSKLIEMNHLKIEAIETPLLTDPMIRLRDALAGQPNSLAFGISAFHQSEAKRLGIENVAEVPNLNYPLKLAMAFNRHNRSQDKIKKYSAEISKVRNSPKFKKAILEIEKFSCK